MKEMTKQEKAKEYEEMMSKAMFYATSGMFILPIIYGFMAKSQLNQVENKYIIRTNDQWKRTLINWQLFRSIIGTIFLGLYLLFTMTFSMATIGK